MSSEPEDQEETTVMLDYILYWIQKLQTLAQKKLAGKTARLRCRPMREPAPRHSPELFHFPLPHADHCLGQIVGFLQQIEGDYSAEVGVIIDILAPDNELQLPTRYVLVDELQVPRIISAGNILELAG